MPTAPHPADDKVRADLCGVPRCPKFSFGLLSIAPARARRLKGSRGRGRDMRSLKVLVSIVVRKCELRPRRGVRVRVGKGSVLVGSTEGRAVITESFGLRHGGRAVEHVNGQRALAATFGDT